MNHTIRSTCGTYGRSLALVLMMAGIILSGLQPAAADPLPVSDTAETILTPIREIAVPSPEQLGPEVVVGDPGPLDSPPENPQVGDSWFWWLFIHVGMPHFESRLCTVRGKTDRGYVVVEDTQWNVNIFQSDVDAILERWENSSIGPYPGTGIYDINTQHFGEAPDILDNDPRIYIMYFDFGNSSDGFFFYFDEYPDGTFSGLRSNECEVIYLNTQNGQSPSGNYMLSVIAHEFEHMIHWFHDENELSWVDEGMGELAMWLYGRPDVISMFNTNPDNPLTVWDGNWADYIKTYLWSLYFYERYGGQPSVLALVDEAANSITGYENTLDAMGYSESVADVFADWAVANYLDDPTLGDGRWGYVGDDLPPFNPAGVFTNYPLGNTPRTVNHWATDYYRFINLEGMGALELGFDGSDNNVFAVWALTLHADESVDVGRMTLDPLTQSGSIIATGLSDPDDEVVLVVASVSSYGTTSYEFNAAQASADIAGDATRIGLSDGLYLAAGPNPSRGAVELRLDWAGSAVEMPAVAIFDAAGRLVRSLSGNAVGGASSSLLWNGRDAFGRPVSPGVYYARAWRGGRAASRELIILQ